MCYHISFSRKLSALEKRYGCRTDFSGADSFSELYRVSAFNYPDYPVITAGPEMRLYRWGLIPYWVKTEPEAEKIRKRTFNARAESIFEKPSFRTAIRSRRCIVPVTGFFDWRHEESGRKIPYYIYKKDKSIFSMAGIYDEWVSPGTGQTIPTFSIITTDANSLMRQIHNTNFRMPVILLREDEEKWLYPLLRKGDIGHILSAGGGEELEAYVLRKEFLRKSPHDSSILCAARKEEEWK